MEGSAPPNNRPPYKEYIAPAAIGLAVVVVSAWIIRQAMRQHADSIEVYKQQLATIDPGRVQQWHHRVQFEKLCYEIESELLCERLTSHHFTDPSALADATLLPQTYWCPNLTTEQVIAQLRANPALTTAAANAGVPLDEACSQILTGDILPAGPSPLRSPPSRLWPAFKALTFMGAAAAGGFVAAKRTWPQDMLE
jgi:hypothetical protein